MQHLIHALVGHYTATAVTNQTLHGCWSVMPLQVVKGTSGSLLLQHKKEPCSFCVHLLSSLVHELSERADYGTCLSLLGAVSCISLVKQGISRALQIPFGLRGPLELSSSQQSAV